MLLSELLDEFMIYNQATNKVPKTLTKRYYQMKRFIEYVPCEHLEDVTAHDVRLFIMNLQNNQLANTYINSFIKTLRAFYAYCEQETYIEPRQNIMKRITLLKELYKQVPIFGDDELLAMLKYRHRHRFITARNVLLIMLLAETGIRSTELRQIKLEDISRYDILIANPKNRRQRLISLSDITALRLRQYLKLRQKKLEHLRIECDYLFISSKGDCLSASGLKLIIQNVVTATNPNIKARASPHTFRHTFAHKQLEQGISIYEISRLLGHSHVQQTEHYLRGVNDKHILQKHRNNTPITRIYWRR